MDQPYRVVPPTEYAIADLLQGVLGLRWRTQRELVAGTGQFTCGAKVRSRRRSAQPLRAGSPAPEPRSTSGLWDL